MVIARVQPFPPPPAPAPGPWKAADVERFPDDGYRYEIWRGELVRMAPAGGRHGECEANLVAALRQQTRALGRVYTGDTGFLLRRDPDVLVSPTWPLFVTTDCPRQPSGPATCTWCPT